MTQYRPRTPSRNCDDGDTSNALGKLVIPTCGYTAAPRFEKKDHSWFVISDIPTDLSIHVEGITFYVHKYAVVSKSGYLGRVDLDSASSEFRYDIKLDQIPGGPSTFERVTKFCYGHPIDLSPNNVAALRCASELLEMTEEFEDGNLISKTEAFLTFIVLTSWRDSIIVLKMCEDLSPWAENLQIVRRCCDSISWKAFQDKKSTEDVDVDRVWWFVDLANLRIDHFVRIIAALKSKGVKPQIAGSCIKHYADKWLSDTKAQKKEQKTVIESLVSILPPQKEAVSCKFLLWMLKMAVIYSITPALITELEKRVGSVLHDADVLDLLIPNCDGRDQGFLIHSPEERTMYNTDTVQRIMEYFLMHEHQNRSFENLNVSKLLDSYLAEIATDPKLTISKFQALAEALSENARICHDGLYRAIDVYLKTHPSLQEHDRKRLCRIMNCQKLSFDACMHVAQNERLPLKTVIQVLFCEQEKMRIAMQNKEKDVDIGDCEGKESWSSAKTEIKTLRTELEMVKETLSELQRDYSDLLREYEKQISKQQNTSRSWMLGWRKMINATVSNGKAEAENGGRKRTGFRRPSNIIRTKSMS
ncbi:hypothetical protein RND81_06G028500 [Saponaria officinalis]|uniref:Uncharacterized protein n=1 Tax=Saponaria officinalis TaxID=3572 RepID=A0AAW1K772_SAPOF